MYSPGIPRRSQFAGACLGARNLLGLTPACAMSWGLPWISGGGGGETRKCQLPSVIARPFLAKVVRTRAGFQSCLSELHLRFGRRGEGGICMTKTTVISGVGSGCFKQSLIHFLMVRKTHACSDIADYSGQHHTVFVCSARQDQLAWMASFSRKGRPTSWWRLLPRESR